MQKCNHESSPVLYTALQSALADVVIAVSCQGTELHRLNLAWTFQRDARPHCTPMHRFLTGVNFTTPSKTDHFGSGPP